MQDKKHAKKRVVLGEFEVVLELPYTDKDLKYSKDNNITCFRHGETVWNVEELLNRYSEMNH